MKQFLKKSIGLVLNQKKVVEKTYASYEDALINCGGPGYHDDTIAEIVLNKTIANIEELNRVKYVDMNLLNASYIISILINSKKEINIIDIGGACGLPYFICKKILGDKVKLNWRVVETESMVRAASKLTQDGLSFYSDLDKCIAVNPSIDLIISSSTIPYLKSPAEYLLNITKINAPFIFLTRLSFSQTNKDIITIQRSMLSENGSGRLPDGFTDKEVRYPHTNMCERDFEEIMGSNYNLIQKFDEISGIRKVNNEPIVGYGVLFERK
jgi:putative methyltransferase (TIGR04325 family)